MRLPSSSIDPLMSEKRNLKRELKEKSTTKLKVTRAMSEKRNLKRELKPRAARCVRPGQADHFQLLERIFGLACEREDMHCGSTDSEHLRVANLIGPTAVQADSERLEWDQLEPVQDVFRTHAFPPPIRWFQLIARSAAKQALRPVFQGRFMLRLVLTGTPPTSRGGTCRGGSPPPSSPRPRRSPAR